MIRVHKLTTEELVELEQVHRQTRDADMRSRCEMVLYSGEGLSPPEIARRVRFSDETVRRVLRRYEAEGIAGPETKPRSGRPRRVT